MSIIMTTITTMTMTVRSVARENSDNNTTDHNKNDDGDDDKTTRPLILSQPVVVKPVKDVRHACMLFHAVPRVWRNRGR